MPMLVPHFCFRWHQWFGALYHFMGGSAYYWITLYFVLTSVLRMCVDSFLFLHWIRCSHLISVFAVQRSEICDKYFDLHLSSVSTAALRSLLMCHRIWMRRRLHTNCCHWRAASTALEPHRMRYYFLHYVNRDTFTYPRLTFDSIQLCHHSTALNFVNDRSNAAGVFAPYMSMKARSIH